jgi:phage terminase large subunit-like protein
MAEKELNFKLHPAQMEIIKSPARFKVVAAGRRFGKSYYAAVSMLINALKSENEAGYDIRNKEVWYVAPTFQQAKDIMWSLLQNLGRDVIAKTLENTATLYLVNGRKIQLKGSDRPDTLRGSGLSYVVLDEYAFMKPDVWEEILFPTLMEVKGDALFIGTPAGKNHFYDLFVDGMKDTTDEWGCWHFNTTDNPIIDKTLIERARDKLSSHSFRQEFEASFESVGGGLFKEDWITYEDKEPDDGYYYITVDPAGFTDSKQLMKGKLKQLDETAISIVYVHPNGWWVKEIDAGRWGVRETALRILKHCKEVQPVSVGIERGALMTSILPYLEDYMRRLNVYPRVEALTHGGVNKSNRITWALQGRFEHGRIQLNPGEWNKRFVEQLLDFPNPMTHDDMIDSLAYIDQIAKTNYQFAFHTDTWEPLDDIAGI